MKKWILPILLIFFHIYSYAQAPATDLSAQQVFEEAYRSLKGLGREYDPEKALQLFNQSADLGNVSAINALGNLYANGEAGLTTDINKAITLYKKAGNAGYGNSFHNLAMIYREGKLVPQNFGLAARYCQLGVSANNSNCKRLLAYFYYKGLGVTQDYKKAFELFYQLAQTGDINAQYFTGLCFRNGYGTVVNKEESKKWLLMAAGQGDYQAQHELTVERFPENMTLINPRLKEQVQKLKKHQEQFITSSDNDLSGTYQGYAVYYDFSGEFVHQIVPLKLELHKTNSGYKGNWKEGDTLATTIKGRFYNNMFSFDTSSQYTRNNYYSYRDTERYQFQAANLDVKYIKDSMHLIGDVKFYSIDRREPGQPVSIILSKKVADLQPLKLETIQMTLSPNPVMKDLKATFTISRPCKVSLQIHSINGKLIKSEFADAFLPTGTYTYPINVENLSKTGYILTLSTSTGITQSQKFIKL